MDKVIMQVGIDLSDQKMPGTGNQVLDYIYEITDHK